MGAFRSGHKTLMPLNETKSSFQRLETKIVRQYFFDEFGNSNPNPLFNVYAYKRWQMFKQTLLLASLILGACIQLNAQSFSWWQESSNTLSRMRNVNFIDNSTGWAFGDSSDINGFVTGVVLKTTDQGLNWSMQVTPSPSIRVYSSHFFSLLNGVAVGRLQTGGGVTMITSNGGTTWQVDSMSFPERLHDVAFANVNTGWICGRNGYGARSNDGGNTWIVQTTNTTEHLYSVAFCDTSTGWMVGADPGTGGTIIKTTDGGSNWTLQTNTVTNDLMSVFAFSPAKAIAVGFAGTIVMTTDSGNTWQQITSGTPEDLLDVTFTDTLQGWAVGTAGTMLVTADGGLTWSPFVSNTTNPINSICMKDTTLGWFCGDNGDIFFYGFSPVGFGENDFLRQEKIYPNPTSGVCIITSQEPYASFVIYDLAGNIILQESQGAEGEKKIDMSMFSPGTYFIVVTGADGTMTVNRIIKQ